SKNPKPNRLRTLTLSREERFGTSLRLPEFSDLQHLPEPFGKSLSGPALPDRRAKDFVASGSAAVVDAVYSHRPNTRQHPKCRFRRFL
ncbi:hypothetical protein, partial [Siculibacillus lacustris]|uniref:hypothetical protein n=1 Tax=Siculibacillus lacustris TaxID=1549641 RepID=UPI0019CF75DA